MSRLIPIFIRCHLFILLAVMLTLSACNTESRWASDRQRPEGPTTDMAQPEGIDLPDIKIANANEVDIVESVLMHRARYRTTLEMLRDYYAEHGYNTKQKWAEAELADLSRVKPYKYIMSAEIPETRLRPKHSIAEADAMYDQGVELMRKGGHGIPAIYNRQHMRQALDLFTELIRKYPDSDKIDDAAFLNGEILKEYFRDCELLAVQWYERCRQWDPNSPHPALFQAAVIYDYRLKDRAKALELYHRVLEEESGSKSNTAFASRRVHELTEGVAQIHQPRRSVERESFAVPAPASSRSFNNNPSAYEPARQPTYGSGHYEPGTQSPTRADQSRSYDDHEELVPVVDLGPDD